MAFSLTLTEKEEGLARRYSESSGISMEEAFKRALFEKIEDEYDLTAGEAAYSRFLENPQTYTHSEVLKMFDDDE